MMQKTASEIIMCIRIIVASLVFFQVGCSSAYYSAMEALGHPKRDLLVTRVEQARDSQKDAKEQFKTALEKFQSVVSFHGGDLEERYKSLDREFEKSKAEAGRVSNKIESVKDVAEALFAEWQSELRKYSNSRLRNESKRELEETRSRYGPLIQQMERAKDKMAPVVGAFQDQVLFLKHNLNARAISSIKGELLSVKGDVAKLVREMERSIDEANAFVRDSAK